MKARSKRPAYRIAALAVLAALVPLVLAASASAALTITFFDGTLIVQSDGDDAITITCNGGNVKVNGADPLGPLPCANVELIAAVGGPGPNVIDLSGVASSDFTLLDGTEVLADAGSDTVTGSALGDRVNGGEGTDNLTGGSGDDTLSGDAGNDMLDGGSGADLLYGSIFLGGVLEPGTNTVTGGPGDDYLDPGAQTGVAAGGDGVDGLTFEGSNGNDTLTATGPDGTLTAGSNSTSFQGIEGFFISGLGGDDVITTGAGADFLDGGGENDTLNAGAGDDQLSGGFGTDVANGQEGSDLLSFVGTAGNDTLTFTPPDGSLSAGGSTTTFTGVANGHLDGFFGDDTLTTGEGADVLNGNIGNDTLNAGAGDDRLLGGDFGFPGSVINTLDGGDGSDTMEFEGTNGNDTLNAPSSDGSLSAGARTDNFTSIQNLEIQGFDGNDIISTGPGADLLQGGIGNDTLKAGGGNDSLAIFSGSDSADGEAGSDAYFVFFRALGTVTLTDTGPPPGALAAGDEDSLTVFNCFGVTVTATQAVKGGEVVNYSGIEKPPCGFAAPPPPPPPPSPPPPPPPPQPPPPSPPPPPPARDRTAPVISIAGVRGRGAGCTARDFRVRVRILDRSRLSYARLFLDGRRRLNTTKKSFNVLIRASRLRSGRHRITVTARDRAGNRSSRAVRFTRCARRR